MICIFGLSFHASKLVTQYVWGQTVVNVKVEKIKYNKIPAITICYPRFLSMKKLSEYIPDIRQDFIEYKSIIETVNDSDYQNKTLKQKISDIYWERFMNTNIPFEVPVHDLFDNFTLPFRFPKRSLYQFEKSKDYFGVYDDFETEYAIEIEAKGTIKSGKNKSIARLRDTNPVESVAMSFRGDQYKCYTFFSELKEKWRKVQMNLNYIAIEIHHDREWFPPNVYDNINTFPQLSMHSSNSIPDISFDNNFLPLNPGFSNEILFSQIDTILLPPNYLTNCKDYDLNQVKGQQFRSDCITVCILNEFRRNSSDCLHRTADLLRKDLLLANKTDKFCPIFDVWGDHHESVIFAAHHSHEIRSSCEENCQNECHNQFFDFEFRKKTKLPLSSWDMRTSAYISHNHLPDQVIEHLPEMTFISFIASFGGLVGMWLGLSALAIFDFMMQFF